MARTKSVLLLAIALLVPPGTASASAPEYPGSVHIGDSGDAVVLIQTAVGTTADGDFGPATQAAVRAWQSEAGLLDTGWVGPVTWAVMFGQETTPDSVVFEGSGWGHGIGMSQYGARGMAAEGASYTEILSHFYTGAGVAQAADVLAATPDAWMIEEDFPVWVNILDEVATVTVEPSADGLVFCQNEPDIMETLDSGDSGPYVTILQQRLVELGYEPGSVDGDFGTATEDAVRMFQTDAGIDVDGRVGPQTRSYLWPEDDSGESCFIELEISSLSTATLTADDLGCTLSIGGVRGGCVASLRTPGGGAMSAERHVEVLDLIDSATSSAFRSYADGFLRIRPATPGTFHVVHQTDVDTYVAGIAEVPWSWPVEARRAQAVAARSYGMATMRVGSEPTFSASRKVACWCQLYSTTASQVYVGHTRELVAAWGDEAAHHTDGQVLEHPTAGLVQAFYSSSTGGRTQNNEDRWGPSPVPYLRSVDDHWSLDARVNAKAVWTHTRSVGAVESAFDLDQLLSLQVASRYDSGSVAALTVIGVRDGETVQEEVSIATAVSKLGLPGRYFNVGWPFPSADVTPFIRRFDDIAASVHADDIETIAELGITKGCNPPANDEFCPTSKVTRGQIAAFLARALSLPPTSEDFFTDDENSVFEGDINRLAAAGVTTGCGGGKYCPDDLLPREQMAAFLVRALGLPAATTADRFIDDDASSFESLIDALGESGITKGCNPPENDRFCPQGHVTREQMASFLVRSLAYLESSP